MGSCMKTTIDIANDLLVRSKEVARREHLTLRMLVEQGLQHVLAEHQQGAKPFKLRGVKPVGGGFCPEFKDVGWDAMRDEIYRGRGS